LALVIDRSASVQPFMDEIQRAAYQALSQLKKGDTVCLFTFANSVERRENLTTDFQGVARAIASIQGESGVLQLDALHEAVTYLERAAPDKRKAVIMISDNAAGNFERTLLGYTMVQGRKMRTNSNTIDGTVKLAQQTETVVYSVQMDGGGSGIIPLLIPSGGATGKKEIAALTAPTGGEVIEASGSVQKALAQAVNRLKTRYTLGYDPGEERDDFRTIEVRLVDRFGTPGSNYTLTARSGTYEIARSNQRR
jgi:VWFA-related protein